jgi:hypothetical protein
VYGGVPPVPVAVSVTVFPAQLGVLAVNEFTCTADGTVVEVFADVPQPEPSVTDTV